MTGAERIETILAEQRCRDVHGDTYTAPFCESCRGWAAHVAALVAAETGGVRLPDPKGGCCCEPFSQSAGGVYTEHLAEYEPACPVHSEHVYNPRTGVWTLAAETGGLAERVKALYARRSREYDGWLPAASVPMLRYSDVLADLRALLVPDQQTSEGSEREPHLVGCNLLQGCAPGCPSEGSER